MQIDDFTRVRCPELAVFLEGCCSAPLTFDGEDPNRHSADNHIHLWALEYWSDRHRWIDLDYRVAFAETIFERWRGRLKGLPPYLAAGYRVYLYEDLAPTVSVVAETATGFPYPGEPQFVASPRQVMEHFAGRNWGAIFHSERGSPTHQQVLDAVETHAGSISRPTADALGLKPGALRTLIEQMGLERRVNALRKRFKRRPARFRAEADFALTYRIFEQRWPAGYR